MKYEKSHAGQLPRLKRYAQPHWKWERCSLFNILPKHIRNAENVTTNCFRKQLDKFLKSVSDEKTLACIVQALTTYRCEHAFSSMINITNDKRNWLQFGHDFRLSQSMTIPRIKELSKNEQAHLSHQLQLKKMKYFDFYNWNYNIIIHLSFISSYFFFFF